MTYADNYQPDAERPRKSAIMRVLGWLLGWALIIGAVATAVAAWAWLSFTAPGPLQTTTTVNVERGLNRSEIAFLLKDKGIVSDARIFSAAAAANTLRGRFIKPGEYEFQQGSSMQEVMAQMLQGRILTYKLTIPEGWTTEMALQRIRENEVLQGDVTVIPPEGTLLANTLVFQRGTTRQQFVETLMKQQDALVEEVWAQRPADTPVKSKQELVTLASIVEKETGKAEERPRVAAVFLNRLRKSMRLQSDPTIIYGLVGGKGKLDRALTRSDIDGVTPYNTYAIDGLPPGPIAIPGRASLEAVIRPAQTEDLYFVADGTGGHAFARTLDEHNDNVAKWRKVENGAQAADAPVAPTADPPAAPSVEAAPADSMPVIEEQPPAASAAPAEQPQPSPPAETEVAAAPAPDAVPTEVSPPADDAPVLDIKPGSIIRIGQKLVPIPAPRALKQ